MSTIPGLPLVSALLVSGQLLGCHSRSREQQALQAAKEAMMGLQEEDWDTYARHVDPQFLNAFQDSLWPLFDSLASVDTARESEFLFELFGVSLDHGPLVKTSARDFYIGALKGWMTWCRNAVGRVKQDSVSILGSVPEGDSTYHVLARVYQTITLFPPRDSSGNEVHAGRLTPVSIHKHGAEWKLDNIVDISGLSSVLRQAIRNVQDSNVTDWSVWLEYSRDER